MSGPDLQTVQDVVVGLPRSVRDHLTEQPCFGPDGALYFCQASNSSMGAPDDVWGNRPERLLSAAILRLDVTKVTPGQPLNVVDARRRRHLQPLRPGAPLTIYATGVRNTFDLLWSREGILYAPNNGSSAGGNTPGALPAADAVGRHNGTRPDTGAPYAGPDVPALTNVPDTEPDFLFRITPGKYYGHPNPARGEYVLNGGNPGAARRRTRQPRRRRPRVPRRHPARPELRRLQLRPRPAPLPRRRHRVPRQAGLRRRTEQPAPASPSTAAATTSSP